MRPGQLPSLNTTRDSGTLRGAERRVWCVCTALFVRPEQDCRKQEWQGWGGGGEVGAEEVTFNWLTALVT